MRAKRLILARIVRLAALGFAGITTTTQAATVDVSWTMDESSASDFASVLAELKRRTGAEHLSSDDFRLDEDRALAFSHYRRYEQVREQIAIAGHRLRLWTKPDGSLLKVEARVETAPASDQDNKAFNARAIPLTLLKAAQTLALAEVKLSSDHQVRALSAETQWLDQTLVRHFVIKARRGQHQIIIDLSQGKVKHKTYRLYPRVDYQPPEQELGALLFPIYEEYNGQILPRREFSLKYVATSLKAPASNDNPYSPLAEREYRYSRLDEEKARTAEGQAAGYWSLKALQSAMGDIERSLPLVDNRLDTSGAVLHGRYATINIHPEAPAAFPSSSLPLRLGPTGILSWKAAAPLPGNEGEDYLLTPQASYLGLPLLGRAAALQRDSSRHSAHDPAFYMSTGFDELQVYYAINQLFDSLRPMGFVDPDLGERPFHAFLYDPDIESRDNAYYTDDTINFTTYSADALNYARDNTTIWHELGHGVMDRLMGNKLELADTGGLSEGMADFIAHLVVEDVTLGEDFPGRSSQRIFNNIAFHLTNEVHDDGEAYGGALKQILDAALVRYGRRGLPMTADLILEAMRLTRDHPEMTAEVFFANVQFADRLGRKGLRVPMAFHDIVAQALAARNFQPEERRARLVLIHEGKAVDADTAGARGYEIPVHLAANESTSKTIEVQVLEPVAGFFQWPLTLEIGFRGGALQGAIRWQDEEQGPIVHTLNEPGASTSVPLTVLGGCDAINRDDGSCSDYAYVRILNAGSSDPIAKKRFYLRVHPKP